VLSPNGKITNHDESAAATASAKGRRSPRSGGEEGEAEAIRGTGRDTRMLPHSRIETIETLGRRNQPKIVLQLLCGITVLFNPWPSTPDPAQYI
jgi:hypothetical protein